MFTEVLEMGRSSSYRELYDRSAIEAKYAFVSTLKDWMLTNDVSQRKLSEMTGYQTAATSEFLRKPDRCPENFIRVVSLAVPELGGEYLRFRMAADAKFFEMAEKHQVALGRMMTQAQCHHMVVEASKEIEAILTRLKNAI